MRKKYICIMALTVGLSAIVANADVVSTGTFVPAVDGGNSFLSSDGTSNFSTSPASTGFWDDRSGGVFNIVGTSPSGGFQARPTNTEYNEVVTTLTGLTIGQSYDIYMIHGVNTGDTSGNIYQNISAGFTSGSLANLLEVNSTLTGDSLGADGTWKAAEQLIGSKVADSFGEIKVFVGMGTGDNFERSIYNGLSVIPEPATLGMVALFGGGILFIRRKLAM